ncbi:hypothetical protein CYLTODRAFT_418071 [Cylindrobasidium torrendii FP15055 ss-10]|uniref:Uncharacterized protein n=1 Tax=Cylindrobasidium torrendii FP15055 ss-10 TaxID=1314674 RepID=A0A0D7BQ45_9AGAR|nr:hypothetical protein CYLTODRAFT_418071 [Cylindrobasidium torrendii FP15055 ss-10]
MYLLILTGSFASLGLVLLGLRLPEGDLVVLERVPGAEQAEAGEGWGPHQYLRWDASAGLVWATTWADPPALHVFSFDSSIATKPANHEPSLEHIAALPIFATSSYVSFAPEDTLPENDWRYAYSMGGPTGEVHAYRGNAKDGWEFEKVQETPFVDPARIEAARNGTAEVDRTRKALRTGSHAIEFQRLGDSWRAYVPVLATDAIHIYDLEQPSPKPPKKTARKRQIPIAPPIEDESEQAQADGKHGSHRLQPRSVLHTPPHSGPRHVKTHPKKPVLYVVTEHDNRLLVYDIADKEDADESTDVPDEKQGPNGETTFGLPKSNAYLVGSYSLFPECKKSDQDCTYGVASDYRGDTLALSPDARYLYTTTRGGNAGRTGWLGVWALGGDGFVMADGSTADILVHGRYWETPTSGGKANAIEARAYPGEEGKVLVVLTDDDEKTRDIDGPFPSLYVLEHDTTTGAFNILASFIDLIEMHAGRLRGASHAIWVDGIDDSYPWAGGAVKGKALRDEL